MGYLYQLEKRISVKEIDVQVRLTKSSLFTSGLFLVYLEIGPFVHNGRTIPGNGPKSKVIP